MASKDSANMTSAKRALPVLPENTRREYLLKDIAQLRHEILKKKNILQRDPEANEEIRQKFVNDPLKYKLLAQEKLLEIQLEFTKRPGNLDVIPNEPELLFTTLANELRDAEAAAQDTDVFFETRIDELRLQLEGLTANIEKETELMECMRLKVNQKRAESRLTSEEEEKKEYMMQLRKENHKLQLKTIKVSNLMVNFIAKHFPEPQKNGDNLSRKSKKAPPAHVKLLQQLIDSLVAAYVQTPQDSYVDIDDTWWPLYIEFLLRHNIAVMHPTDRGKIRLESVEYL